AFMSPPRSQPLAKPAAAVKGRRTRIAIAILVTWALVASIAFGWTWVADQRVEQQQRESIRATINRIVWDLSSEFFAASASTQALLMTRSLHYGWIGAVWLDDVQDRVTDLFVTTEGWAAKRINSSTFPAGGLRGSTCVIRRDFDTVNLRAQSV